MCILKRYAGMKFVKIKLKMYWQAQNTENIENKINIKSKVCICRKNEKFWHVTANAE